MDVESTAQDAAMEQEDRATDALLDAGCESFIDKHGVDCWRDPSDGATWAGSAVTVCKAWDIEFNA